jgi:hypothetical protein
VCNTPTGRVADSRLVRPLRQSTTAEEPRRNDLFHAKVPVAFIREVFDVMRDTPQHTYQLLTKRALRLRRIADSLNWPENVWMGVSVEDTQQLRRVDDLRATPAKLKFLSAEPLLGPLFTDTASLDLTDIGWVITGGESGHRARPCDTKWVRYEMPAHAKGSRSSTSNGGAALQRRAVASSTDVLTPSFHWLLRSERLGRPAGQVVLPDVALAVTASLSLRVKFLHCLSQDTVRSQT